MGGGGLVRVDLVDGTYELFRAYFGAPSARVDGREVAATRTFARSMLALLREGATHVGIAFDHQIESFRNELFPGYKTGAGIEPDLLGQFELVERVAKALGFLVWPMVEHEADDALATAAHRLMELEQVEGIRILSPDKDLTQCVRGKRVVTVDRRRERTLDDDGVRERYGVPPSAIPDYLALVGDSADGIPGIPRWGARSSAQVLAHYGDLESIPHDPAEWAIKVRGAKALAENLSEQFEAALLYRTLARLVIDAPIDSSLEALEWRGAQRKELGDVAEEIGDTRLLERVPRWAGE